MALNFSFCLDMETPRRDRDRDDMTPSIASESPPPPPPPPPPPLDRAGPRAAPPPRPPRLRARYMHIGRIMSGTDGVMMKMWDEEDGSEAGVPVIACSLADFGRNGKISTPVLTHHINISNIIIIILIIIIKLSNMQLFRSNSEPTQEWYYVWVGALPCPPPLYSPVGPEHFSDDLKCPSLILPHVRYLS